MTTTTTRSHRRRGRVLALAVAALLGLAACSGGGSGGGAGAPDDASGRGGRVPELTLAGYQGNFGYPTPYGSRRGPGKILASLVFDQLAWPDSTGRPQPWLAESWTTSPDGTTWTFHLREDARWQDGRPLTAEDVVFSFNYVLTGPARGGEVPETLERVTAKGPHTVLFHLAEPDASFLTDVSGPFGVSIVPKHIWSGVDDPTKFRGDKALIGSGPYKLVELDPAQGSYHFVANDDFYLGPPVVQEIKYVPAPDPLLALQRGRLDAASPFNEAVPQQRIAALQQKFTMLTKPGAFNLALHFNLDKGFPYDNRTFRHAVAYALNRADMVDRLLFGRGVPGPSGGLVASSPFHADGLPQYAHDPARAKRLLDQLGFSDTNGDGFREAPGGAPFAIPLIASAEDVKATQLVVEYLRDVGLRTDLKTLDQASMDQAASAGNYSMAVLHYGGLNSGPDFLCLRFASNQPFDSFAAAQGYQNQQLNRLCARQATATDPSQRMQMVQRIQQIIARDLPVISLYVPKSITFVTDVFDAWAYTPGCPPCGATNNKFMLVTGHETGS